MQHRKPAQFNQLLQVVFAVAVFGLMFALVAAFSLNAIVKARGNAFDFFPHYTGGQFYWRGQSPYSQVVTDTIQIGMWGTTLPPEGYDQYRFAYPAYVLLILTPMFVFPAPVAIALWMAAQFFGVITGIILWLRLLAWKPPLWLMPLLLVGFTLALRYPINNYLVAQFTGTMLLLFVLAAWMLHTRRDAAAGVLCALATIPPTTAAPLALVILGAFALHRRPRGLIAFFATLAVLTAVTILQIGWWIPDFINQLVAYRGYAKPVWAPGLIEPLVLRVGFIGAVGVGVAWAVMRLTCERPLAMMSAAVIGVLLLVPQTGNYYLSLMILPLLASLSRSADPTISRGTRWLVRVGVALAVLSVWVYQRAPQPEIQHLLLPLHGALLLLLVNYKPASSAAQAAVGN